MKPGHITYHIGLHKTGTTSIQEFFHTNREFLLRQGMDFPLIGLREKGCPAHTLVADHARLAGGERNAGLNGKPTPLQRITATWTPAASRVLISCEDLYLIAKLPDPAAAIARLGGLLPFASANCVVFIRRPDAHIRSLYGTVVNRGPRVSDSFQAYLERQTQALITGTEFTYYRYAENLKPWQAIGDLTILEYEHGEAVGQILQMLNLKVASPTTADETTLNISRPFEVSILQATANDLLMRDAINEQQHKAIHRLLVSVDLARLSQLTNVDIHGLFEPQVVDLRAFRAAFLSANKERFYAGRIPEAIELPQLRQPEANHHKALVLHLGCFVLNKRNVIEALV